jgi:hypothetical protein
MAILTSREFDRKEKPEPSAPASPVKRATKKKGEQDMKVRMILKRVAAYEESNCAFFDSEGKQHSINVKFGIYEIPGGPEQEAVVERLKAAGFSVLDTVEEEEGEVKDVQGMKAAPKKFSIPIRLQHPDYTPDNAITADIKVGDDGTPVHIEAGIVESDDPAVVSALASSGYLVMNPHDLEKEMGI